MKKRNSFLKNVLLVSIFVSFLISSCQLEPAPSNSKLAFQEFSTIVNQPLYNNQEFPAFEIKQQLLLPNDSAAFPVLYETMTKAFFEIQDVSNQSMMAHFQEGTDFYVQQYKSIIKDMDRQASTESSSFNWMFDKTSRIVFQNEHYLSFEVRTYYYSGGAHGNTISSYYLIDLSTYKIISDKEFFKADNCAPIIGLQKQVLKKGDITMESFYDDGFKCDANFYITEKGLVFHYNQYEINAYAVGPIDIVLDFTNINPYLLHPEKNGVSK
ncbi:MAG: hypothetical protein B7C24_04740 [Bacteroidetes bacterium 4572_77]|nr:MAG: hypothetical protein B7C24_04740 [Bacteroidetes bacterium 4572_77]